MRRAWVLAAAVFLLAVPALAVDQPNHWGAALCGAEVTADGVTLTYRRPAQFTYALLCHPGPCPPPPPEIWREVYVVRGGRLVLDRVVYASVKIEPSEVVEWPEGAGP